MERCSNCGNRIYEGDLFCRGCGTPVSQVTKGDAVSEPEAENPRPGDPTTQPGQAVSPPPDTSLRQKAEKRVKQRMELLSHIGVYLVVNGFLVVVWALSGAGYPWFLWVMAGWGVGLLTHLVSYFTGTKGDSARERLIQREMEKLDRGRRE